MIRPSDRQPGPVHLSGSWLKSRPGLSSSGVPLQTGLLTDLPPRSWLPSMSSPGTTWPVRRWYLYGTSRCQARIFNNSIFLAFFLCYPFVRPRASSFRPDRRSHGRRAQGRSRMAVAQVVHQYRAFPEGHSLTCPEPRRQARGRSGRLGGVHPTASKGQRRSEASLLRGGGEHRAPHTCIRQI